MGNSESGYIAVHPDNPNIVISGAVGSSAGGGGNLLHYDHETSQVRIITVWPELATGRGAIAMKYRFQWTYPIFFSPHNADDLYVAGNIVFRSTDQGNSWEAISPDLTRNDVTTQEPSGGPITKDTSGAEIYGTIFALVESLHEQGVFWAGSDDGLVHISRDGGRTWDDVTPPEIPAFTLINMIEVSPHDASTAYLAATRYKLDDTSPMLFKTQDYGKTWTDISQGIRDGDYTRVIREDPVRRGLLYAGTETGVYLSTDDGSSWQSLQANLPSVPVYDLTVKDGDLVAATHGRSFWVLDGLTQVHQIADDLDGKAFHLLKPGTTIRLRSPGNPRKPSAGKHYRLGLGADVTFVEVTEPGGETFRKFLDAGENPPYGVVIPYHVKEKPEEEITLSVLDSNGQLIKTFSSLEPSEDAKNGPDEPRLRAQKGMNRFIWNMRYPNARKVPGDKTTEDMLTGPTAPPGTYQVTLAASGQEQTQTFEIVKDPRVSASQADLEAQFQLLMDIRDKISETHDSINQLRSIRRQVEEWEKRSAGHSSAEAVSNQAGPLKEKLSAIENELVQVEYKGARDRLHLPVKLNRKLAELTPVVASADFAPPLQAFQVLGDITVQIDEQTGLLQDVVDRDVPQFIELVQELSIPAIVPTVAP